MDTHQTEDSPRAQSLYSPTFRLRMTTQGGKGLPLLCGSSRVQDHIVIADHKNGDAQKNYSSFYGSSAGRIG